MAVNRRHIDADPGAVLAVLADGWSYSNWVVGTSHMRAVEPGWPSAGSRLFHASGAWPLVARDETVVESAGERELVLLARGRPFGEARIRLTLDDDPPGCLVTIDETPVSGPGRWLHNPVAEAVLHRRNTEALDRLAAIAERRATPSE